MNEPKKPRTRAALTHEQFFDLVEWLRATENTFPSYAAAARSASQHLGQEVGLSSIKSAMEKAGVTLAQPITPEQQLRRDIADLANALLIYASDDITDMTTWRFELRGIRARNQQEGN